MLNCVYKLTLRNYFFAIIMVFSLLFALEFYFERGKSNAQNVILWWTPFVSEFDREVACGNHKCLFTVNRIYSNHSRLAGFLFYGSQLAVDDLPLPKTNIPWAIYHEESPKNLAFFNHESGQRLFEITSTFSRNSHFPIPLQFLEKIDLITDMSYYVPLETKNKLDIAPVLYIQTDCETPIERDIYVKELMKHIQVDSYGTCLNNKPLPEELKIRAFHNVYERNFMKFVARYKFTIAIENSVCDDYITEKLWRPLIVGSVPIYLGSPTVSDWLPNNKSAVLMKDFPTIEELARYIRLLDEDDELYRQYLQHKLAKNANEKITNSLLVSTLKKHGNVEHMIPAFECFVCESVLTRSYLNDVKKKSVYDCPRPGSKSKEGNFWIQHWDRGACEAKTLQYFINVLKLSNFTRTMFDEQLIKQDVLEKYISLTDPQYRCTKKQ